MKVLVIGGSGFIGSHVLSYLADHVDDCAAFGTFCTNSDIQVPKCSFRQLKVNDRRAVHGVVVGLRPAVVVLVCGSQSIEGCAGIDGRQKEAEEAWRVHAGGTEHVVEACQSCHARLAYVSTDCVFDGVKLFFSEEDEPRPFNAYGRMKRRAEEIVEASGLSYAIIRVSVTFGLRRHAKQFRNFALRVLHGLDQGVGAFAAATNLYNTPIEVTPAAAASAQIALGRHQGVFHVASRDRLSRYEFARRVAEIFRRDPARVVPCEDKTGLRQPNSCLSVGRTEGVIGERFETFQDGLERMWSQYVSSGGGVVL